MKINQLFKAIIPDELFEKLYRMFGYTEISEDYMFSKSDLIRLNTVTNMNTIKDELIQYYLPCKAKIYVTNLDLNKCITIFRQVVRLFGIVLVSKQKYIRHKKCTLYFICKSKEDSDDLNNMRVNHNNIVINFS